MKELTKGPWILAWALAALPASAATISWSSSLYTTSGAWGQFLDTGIFVKTGNLVLAQNVGGNATVFDGINFSAGTISFFPGGTYGGFHDGLSPELSRTGAYGESGPGTVSLGSLMVGAGYRIQALVYDGRGDTGIPGRTIHMDGSNVGQYAYGVQNVTWGNGLLVSGFFTADATTQNFTLEAFTSGGVSKGAQLNALLLHQTADPLPIPEPGSLVSLAGLLSLGVLGHRRRR